MDEATLIRRCVEGDPRAQAELYNVHSARVGRLLARLAGPGGDVDDLRQETFIQAYESIAAFRAESLLSTWLCSIAVRVALGRRRKENRRRAILEAYGRAGSFLGLFSGKQASEDGAEELERKHDAARFAYAVLDGLPDKFRQVLILHEMEEMEGKEIAAILGIKENTVWTRLHRARGLFKARAAELGFTGVENGEPHEM
ncbi:MAG: RNA polymerase sigma factor [Pseudomonadota bacterium]